MQLRISVMARDRLFMKAMRRVRERLQPLLDAFEHVEMVNPIHQAILVGITDEKGDEFFQEVDNDEGFFQVQAGCTYLKNDDALVQSVYEILQRSTRACPFSVPDREQFDRVFQEYRPTISA
jgi:hypothetical protein